jgi:hypothetical protein
MVSIAFAGCFRMGCNWLLMIYLLTVYLVEVLYKILDEIFVAAELLPSLFYFLGVSTSRLIASSFLTESGSMYLCSISFTIS